MSTYLVSDHRPSHTESLAAIHKEMLEAARTQKADGNWMENMVGIQVVGIEEVPY